MGAFDDVTLNWGGRDYTIPANRMMGAIARIEDVVTLVELNAYFGRDAVPLGKISMAFGAVLRYAGVKVDDETVYSGMFDGNADSQAATAAITALLAMMLPKSAKEVNGQAGPVDPNPTQRRKAARNISKSASKHR